MYKKYEKFNINYSTKEEGMDIKDSYILIYLTNAGVYKICFVKALDKDFNKILFGNVNISKKQGIYSIYNQAELRNCQKKIINYF